MWIGGVEKYMTEEFLRDAFSLMGEDSVVSVKVRLLSDNATTLVQ